MKLSRVNKAIVTGIVLIIDTTYAAIGDDVFDLSEKQHVITTIINVALSVYAVWRVPNAPQENA